MKVLICDEDEEYVIHLIEMIKSFMVDEEVYFESFTETPGVVSRIENESFDMAFFGCVIHGRNGFELGRLLREFHPDCILYYLGDDYKYLHEVFRVQGFQYLMKAQDKMLEEDFERGMVVYRTLHYEVCFHLDNGNTIKFLPSEIEYIETNDKGIRVLTTLGRYSGYFEDIKRIKKDLINYHFFQMHPRYFVNMEHIELIRNGELVLANGDSVPTSAMNREVIDEAIQSFMDF